MLRAEQVGYAANRLAGTLEVNKFPLVVKGGGIEYYMVVNVRTVLSRGM
jgi:hypothetical protein